MNTNLLLQNPIHVFFTDTTGQHLQVLLRAHMITRVDAQLGAFFYHDSHTGVGGNILCHINEASGVIVSQDFLNVSWTGGPITDFIGRDSDADLGVAVLHGVLFLESREVVYGRGLLVAVQFF